MKNCFVLLVLMVVPAAHAGTYELLLKGKTCQEGYDQQLNCDYRIGQDFWLSIAGVGDPDAGIDFMKSDFNGKYHGGFGLEHGCVIVSGGKANLAAAADFAFVSPKNGKVYKDWQSCQALK